MPKPSTQARERRQGPTAFVLQLTINGLGAVRSLGRAGIPVIGLDPDPNHIGFASRYCTSKQCPHPVTAPEELVEFLLEEARKLTEPGVLSPASDAFVLFLSRHRDQLQGHFRFNLPSADLIEASLDKRRLYDLADRAGMHHATTFYPETIDDIRHIKDGLDYPIYIKPYYSHLWRAAFPSAGKGAKVFTPEQLVSRFESIIPTGVQVMVQSIIVGPATNVQSVRVYISEAGETIATFTNRKIRQYPVEFGVASLAESIRDPDFQEMGEAFFRDIGYRGFGLIEFKRDDRDGLLKLTDLNPRWLKTGNLATDSGVDFPLIHYLDMIGETPLPQPTHREGVRWLDARDDFASAWSLFRLGELSFGAWMRSWLGARSFSTFAMDDWRPFFQHYEYGRKLLRWPRHMWRHR